MPALAATRRLFVESPPFGCYLLALALLPFRWLSPIGTFQEHTQWTDILVAVAAVLWLIERVRDRDLARAFRIWQVPLAIYLALACVSAAVAVPGFGGSWKTVLLMAELAVLAAITADFATEPVRRRLIARVIVVSALATVALGAIALFLFYTSDPGGLVGGYGDLLPSSHYTRVKAGFESAPLLASFCIFASGVVASRDADLSARLRVPTQVGLALLCLATISRAIIGFLLALLIRWSAAMHGRRRMIVPVAATAACVGCLAALTIGFLSLNPADPSSFSYSVSGPDNPRRTAITSSLTTLGDHPLLGVGPGALPAVNLGLPLRAHFTPLNVAATQGIPALLALGAMFWLLWRSRRRPTDIALWSALAGIAIDGLVGDVDHYRHIWILIGLLSGVGQTWPSVAREN